MPGKEIPDQQIRCITTAFF